MVSYCCQLKGHLSLSLGVSCATGSLSTNGCLLPQSFIGDGVTGNAFELGCFLTMGDDGMSDVFSGLDKLMVVKVVL